MIDLFEDIIYKLFELDEGESFLSGPLHEGLFDEKGHHPTDTVKSLNAAFLITLSGGRHRYSNRAKEFIRHMGRTTRWADLAGFYASAKGLIHEEINAVCAQYPDFADRLKALREWLFDPANRNRPRKTMEMAWSVFFPEGVGISETRQEQIRHLREKRTVRITELNPCPLTDPGRQLLFTSNVLLTVPDLFTAPEDLSFSRELQEAIFQAAREPQAYWYDHPVQIGVQPSQNEVLYGLRCLNEAVAFERARGNMPGERITCLLSVSVTHLGLQKLAKKYLEEEISRLQDLNNMDVYVLTEADTQSIVEKVLVPAAAHYAGYDDAAEQLEMFGVDGEYGRHYSFLKAISAFWNVLIDPEIKGTFKFDLDQVFPQNELVNQSKASVFEHFGTPLWGARGIDSNGRRVELGMIAGALVNERDIHRGLYTPDVAFPGQALSPEDMVFFSALPQALSTEAEMMARYGTNGLNGTNTCLQRVHVTGGTNGILVESLRRHGPFTPSFIGRAEDQAYILSVLSNPGDRLAYVHKDGLIMRHDKEAFAQEAIKAATPGKWVGDYVRILLFSEYAKVLSHDVSTLKHAIDPFTGCFVSIIPATVVFLRFCLRAAALFVEGKDEEGMEFVAMGAPRIRDALNFVAGENSLLRKAYERERLGWAMYFDLLNAIENGLKKEDVFALNLREKAMAIIHPCLING